MKFFDRKYVPGITMSLMAAIIGVGVVALILNDSSNMVDRSVMQEQIELRNETIDSLRTEISAIRDHRLELQNEIQSQRQRVAYWKDRYDSIYEEMQQIDSLSRALPGDSIARSVILDIRAELR